MDPFRWTFLVMIVGMMAVRFPWAHRAQVLRKGAIDRDEGPLVSPVRIVFLPAYVAAIVVWFVRPDWIAALDIGLPDAARWGGAALYVAGIGLLLWVHRTLGTNFSHRLRIREDHVLVRTGPYRWVRHPMYTAFLTIALAATLVTSSWLIGVMLPGLLIAIIWSRTPREEAMMEERFGQEYRDYRATTGALLPRLR